MLFGLLVATLLPVSAWAQQGVVAGKVSIEGKPLELASVALYSSRGDSLIDGTITDKEGVYRISCPDSGLYRLQASYVSLTPIDTVIRVSTISEQLRVDFAFVATSKVLDEVVVRGNRAPDLIGRSSYTFTTEQRKQARQVHDLLLMLPAVKADVRTGNVVSAMGESAPVIMLNGVRSSNDEIKTIPTNKIVRVDYYDLAPLRYHTTSAVIDVITKPLDNGHTGGIDLSAAPLATDASGSLYYNYNQGAHRVGVYARGFYRNTRKGRETTERLSYDADRHYDFAYDRNERFGASAYSVQGQYSYSQPGVRTFLVSLSGLYDLYGSKSDFTVEASEGNRVGASNSRSGAFTPVLDLYYDRRYSSGARLYANVVGTLNRVSEHLDNQEGGVSGETVLEDHLSVHNNKASMIAQVEYLQPLKNFALRYGLHGMYSTSDFTIDGHNAPQVHDNQRQYRQQIYLSMEGQLGRLVYYLRPMATMTYASPHYEYPEREVHWYFTPTVVMMYPVAKGQQLRLQLSAYNSVPNLAQTTSEMRKLHDRFYFRNNPDLKGSYTGSAYLRYTLSSDKVELANSLYGRITHLPMITEFVQDHIDGTSAVVQQLNNGKAEYYAWNKVELSYKPLGNELIAVQLFATPMYDRYELSQGVSRSLWSLRAGLNLSSSYKGLAVQAGVELPHKSLSSYFVDYSGWYSSLGAAYYYKQWGFRLSLENMFVPERGTTTDFSLPYYQGKTTYTMRDNYWKIALGVSYSFSIGKEYRLSRELENEDSDSGRM